MRLLFVIVSMLGALCVAAQPKFTLSGYVKDSASGETVIGATLTVSGSGTTVTTNQYGYYSLTLDSGVYQIAATHVSYLTSSIEVVLEDDTERDILMLSRAAAMSEVVVYSRRKDANVTAAQMGKIDLSVSQIKSLPAFLGEVDILKTIQLLPGVRNAGEGNAGFYVRGGGPDQNLIILDDAVVYNTGHLFGFFSIFNSDAIKNVALIKGGMPAQYGGRLSSVLDIAMKDGNANELTGEGGIGLIASRFSLQGPLKKNRSSFIISGRRTYIDVLAKPLINKDSEFKGSGYFFYDLNAKVNYRFSDKDRLYLSSYFGRDVFTFANSKRSFSAEIPWGNSTATLRWNHVFNPKLFANTTLVYNDYKFSFSAAQNAFAVKLASGIRDVAAKIDFDYYPVPGHKLRFGGQATYHKFIPNVLSGRQDSIEFKPSNVDIKYAVENALYVQDDWEVTSKVKVGYGLRWSAFSQIGPYTKYTLDENQNKLDSTDYSALQNIKTYAGFEPRFTFRYSINSTTSVKGSVSRNQQFIHLVSNAGTTLPTDLWVPSTFRVRPQISWQYAAGIFKNLRDNQFETSLELYYKPMKHQIEFREGYTPGAGDPEAEFTFGRGWSYGTELFLNKVRGEFTGWIGYTLSWTWRAFPELNGGRKFPAKYDRRHDLSVVGTYELNERWKLGGVFVFGTGNATSLPVSFYLVEGVPTQEFSDVNKYRLAPYHRMDLSATYTPVRKKKKKVEGSWVFGLYNVYSRLNPYFIYFDQEGSPQAGNLKIESRQVSLFPLLPSVTWNFKF